MRAGDGSIDLYAFLEKALPRDFSRDKPEPSKLDPRTEWVRWNSSRILN
jgi:hypothetical protein